MKRFELKAMMKRAPSISRSVLLVATMTTGLLAGCGSSDDGDVTVMYQVTVTNLSHNQPLSPLAALLHDDDYSAWSIGSAASAGLEVLAEGGDNSTFISNDAAMLMDSAAGSAAVGPGASDTLMVSATQASIMQLSLASMLVNTNDAFTGMTGLDLSAMEIGDSMKHMLPVYDAGTEANDEMAGTIPGPADGGEGFNAARDDVARHPGVVTMDDGYGASVLDSSHRFDAPIAMLLVERVQ